MTENKEKNVNNFLNIRVVLDRSGSMSNCVDQTIDALNGYLIGMQKENTEGVVTIRATGYLNESKQGKKYIGLSLEPDYKTMKAIEEADANESPAPKVKATEEEFPF